MKIITKRVKCGDCNILCGKSEKLLIDCGSDNRGNGLSSQKFAFSKIKNEINNREITDLLISHFHQDHFNGILEIPDSYRFKNVYLPYSIIDRKVPYTKAIARLLAIAPPNSQGFKVSKKIIKLFEKLKKISNNTHFVKEGDPIPIENDKITVLWPEIVKPKSKFNNYDIIEKKFEESFNQIVNKKNNEFSELVLMFVKSFDKYLLSFQNGENDISSSVEEVYNLLNTKRTEFLKELDNDTLQMIKNFSLQQCHWLITSMNATSVVCHIEDRFIFLGDAPKDIVDHIHQCFSKHYKFVKIQHHGTKAHFSDKTPIGKYNLISNGGFEKRKVSKKYINTNNKINNFIICTNAHKQPYKFCEYNNSIFQNLCKLNCIKVSKQFITYV